MGYSLYIISKENKITIEDYRTALSRLSKFNQEVLIGSMLCELDFHKSGHVIRVSGSFGVSVKLAEGFVLNLLLALQSMGYTIDVFSKDFEYYFGDYDEWLFELFASQKAD